MQEATLWTVTVIGVDQRDIETAVAAVQSTFRLSEHQARRLLDGQEYVVKSGLTRSAAEKYAAVLQEIGVRCTLSSAEDAKPAVNRDDLLLVPMEAASGGQTATMPEVGALSLQPLEKDLLLAQGQMRCPKCRLQQDIAAVCIHCGINIQRHQQVQQQSSGTPVRVAQAGQGKVSHSWSIFSVRGAAMTLAALIFAAVYLAQRHEGYRPVGDNPQARAQMQAVKRVLQHPATDMQKLKALIDNGQYIEAEYSIQTLQNMSMEDILWEPAYQNTIEGISYKNNFSQASLDKWVQSTDSAIAYLARGSYFVMQGNLARGTAFASETTEEQFSLQADLHTRGVEDLQNAIEKDRTLFPAYTLLIMCSESSRIYVPAQRYLEEAIRVAPGGYLFRYQYLQTLMPKWGGSYEAMDAFTDKIDADAANYPLLWLLKGYALAERGEVAEDEKQYERAIGYYSEALQYGVHGHWLAHRASCLSRLGDFDAARKDIELAMQYGQDRYAKMMKEYLDSL